MGLIEYHTKNDRNDSWCGWVDSVTKQPVKDTQILERYEPTILAHTGIFSLFYEVFSD
jgi:3-oxoacyl-ACP reductase-like protein